MALEITVGPPQLAINEGNVVLVTDPDGQVVLCAGRCGGHRSRPSSRGSIAAARQVKSRMIISLARRVEVEIAITR